MRIRTLDLGQDTESSGFAFEENHWRVAAGVAEALATTHSPWPRRKPGGREEDCLLCSEVRREGRKPKWLAKPPAERRALLKLTWDSALNVGCPPCLSTGTYCRRAEPQVRFKKMAEVSVEASRVWSCPLAPGSPAVGALASHLPVGPPSL